LSSLVRRITQNNPGLMTGPGTNTYIVGRDRLFVIDPGQDTDEHFRAVKEAIGTVPVLAVIPTHAHPDHWPLAPRLAAALGSHTAGFRSRNGFEPEIAVPDGYTFSVPGCSLEAIHTPGHASDHVCYYLRQERALFSGDHVMGWSTSVISQPDGSLNQYLASLERLKRIDTALMYPAHGEPMAQPRGRIEELILHRHARTAQIVDALRSGDRSADEIVRRVYSDVHVSLHAVARQTVLAHLAALEESGIIRMESGTILEILS
jgi:glyoxylase-like metal-dependent hydrolase (beta-lactamase superfamily II)